MNATAMQRVAATPAAFDALLSDWQAHHPGTGVFALFPEAEAAAVPALQAACRTRGIALVGGIFPALVEAQGFSTQGVWLLRLDADTPAFLIPGVNTAAASAAAKIAAAVMPTLDAMESGCRDAPNLFLLCDAMLPNIGSILDELFLILADRVEYAGVNAGSETFQPMPCLFDAERVLGHAVLALVLPGEQRAVLEHGFTTPQRVMTATSASGNQVVSIDWRPAFEVYREIIGAEYGVALTRENFYQHAVHFPFGILRANQEVVVRIPVALTDEGGLYCVGEVPENAVLVLLRAPEAGGDGCIRRLAAELDSANGPLREHNLLAFYCAGRRMHLGDAATLELDELHAATSVGAMAGALSLGEIGSTSAAGYPLFHNATLVCTPWQAS